MRNVNIRPTCQEIEDMLIKKNIEDLTQIDQELIERHLSYCLECKKYSQILFNINQAFVSPHRNDSMPLLGIRENTLKKISRSSGTLSTFWYSLLSLFEYRIPVYQALGMILVALVLLIGFDYANSEQNSLSMIWSDSHQLEGMISDKNYVLDSLQLLERQRIGKNVLEDSILTQFITTAM
jgi:hypothetical protein